MVWRRMDENGVDLKLRDENFVFCFFNRLTEAGDIRNLPLVFLVLEAGVSRCPHLLFQFSEVDKVHYLCA